MLDHSNEMGILAISGKAVLGSFLGQNGDSGAFPELTHPEFLKSSG